MTETTRDPRDETEWERLSDRLRAMAQPGETRLDVLVRLLADETHDAQLLVALGWND